MQAPELTQDQRIRRAYDVALPFLAERLEHNSVVTHWDVRVAAACGLVDAGVCFGAMEGETLGDLHPPAARVRRIVLIACPPEQGLVTRL